MVKIGRFKYLTVHEILMKYTGLGATPKRIDLHVPHNDKNVTMHFDDYTNVPQAYHKMKNLLGIPSECRLPTLAETVSLVYASFQKDDWNETEWGCMPSGPYAEKIQEMFKTYGLWGFTGILHTRDGAYIQDHPEISKEAIVMDESKLKSLLHGNDPHVKFIPHYQGKILSAHEIAKDPSIQGLIGIEGAEKLEEIARKTGKWKRELVMPAGDPQRPHIFRLYTSGPVLFQSLNNRVMLSEADSGEAYALGIRE